MGSAAYVAWIRSLVVRAASRTFGAVLRATVEAVAVRCRFGFAAIVTPRKATAARARNKPVTIQPAAMKLLGEGDLDTKILLR
jgi:hypothetical protein